MEFLFFITSGIDSAHAVITHNVSKGVWWESIRDSINVLHEHLVPTYIALPTRDQARKEAELFDQNPPFLPNIVMRFV